MKRLVPNRVLVACWSMGAVCSAALLSAPQVAQAQQVGEAHTIYLYDGTGGTDANVAPRSWGNGKAEVKKQIDYASQSALQVTTHNLYEGARFTLAQPVDLTPYRSGVLRLRLRSERLTAFINPPDIATAPGRPGSFGAPGGSAVYVGPPGQQPNPPQIGFPTPGGFGSPGGSGVPVAPPDAYVGPGGGFGGPGGGFGGPGGGFGGPGGFGAQGGYNPYGNAGTGPTGGGPNIPGATTGVYNPYAAPAASPILNDPAQQVPPISQIQVVMRLENGALFGTLDFGANTEASVRPDNFGWQSFTLPIRTMRATPGARGALKSIVLTGNSDSTFQVGQLALAPAGTMAVSLRRAIDAPGTQQTEVTVAPETPVRLVADVETGSVDPLIEWNFDADNTGSLPPSRPEQPLNAQRQGGRGRGRFGGGPGGMMGGVPGSLGGMVGGVPGSPGGMMGGVPGAPGGSPMGGPPTTMPGGMPGGPAFPGGGIPGSPIAMNTTRLDARGVAAQTTFPNEEQDYRVEVTVRDRQSRREIGKASLIVRVRTSS